MKKLFLIPLCFSQIILAQHRKKKVEPVPPIKQMEEYKIPDDRLLNSTLKGSKWYFDLKNYSEGRLYLNTDSSKPDLLNFLDKNRFQITINQKDCKGLIKGTYVIKKIDEGTSTGQLGHRPFEITSRPQKCAEDLFRFLSGPVDVFYEESEKVMKMTEGEDFPPTVPGH